mmetsp:Transcript_88268/g.283108  ORF Transcript_88268/g.283108 Transcript_88268/m.283108 type:complete len:234 (-) Transcript_88268:40-741(-)
MTSQPRALDPEARLPRVLARQLVWPRTPPRTGSRPFHRRSPPGPNRRGCNGKRRRRGRGDGRTTGSGPSRSPNPTSAARPSSRSEHPAPAPPPNARARRPRRTLRAAAASPPTSAGSCRWPHRRGPRPRRRHPGGGGPPPPRHRRWTAKEMRRPTFSVRTSPRSPRAAPPRPAPGKHPCRASGCRRPERSEAWQCRHSQQPQQGQATAPVALSSSAASWHPSSMGGQALQATT